MRWNAETFEIAHPTMPIPTSGYTYRGLGLHIAISPSPKGRRPARWALTHLGTGHRLAFLDGDVATAFPIATEIAEAGNWDFLSPKGWRDCFPDAKARLEEVCAAHPKVAILTVSKPDSFHADIARQIASNRP